MAAICHKRPSSSLTDPAISCGVTTPQLLDAIRSMKVTSFTTQRPSFSKRERRQRMGLLGRNLCRIDRRRPASDTPVLPLPYLRLEFYDLTILRDL